MDKRLFVITGLESPGGAEVYLLRYLKWCNNKQNNYVLCAKGASDSALSREYAKVSTIVGDYTLDRLSYKSYYAFEHFLKKEEITTVCDFRGNFSGLVLFASKIAGVPNRIAFYRESVNQYSPSVFKDVIAWVMKKLMANMATRILSNSHAALKHFHPGYEKYPDKYNVIYNGFMSRLAPVIKRDEVRQTLGISTDAFVIGHVGRLTEAKNHDMIIRCAITLCKSHKDVYFVLIGRGVKEKYEFAIGQDNLIGRIIMTGTRDDIPELLTAMDLFYFPSLNEGQPNALIEAMCNGIPYVTSSIPSIIETAEKSPCGFFVNPTDYHSNLMALEKCYEKRVRRSSELSSWALEKFNPDILFKAFDEEL